MKVIVYVLLKKKILGTVKDKDVLGMYDSSDAPPIPSVGDIFNYKLHGKEYSGQIETRHFHYEQLEGVPICTIFLWVKSL